MGDAQEQAGIGKSYLPDWMTGGDKSPSATQQKGAGGFFAGMYDSGGYIPRGQVGIAGENGPELINGPAYVTSRRRTAALASVVAGMMGEQCLQRLHRFIQ